MSKLLRCFIMYIDYNKQLRSYKRRVMNGDIRESRISGMYLQVYCTPRRRWDTGPTAAYMRIQ